MTRGLLVLAAVPAASLLALPAAAAADSGVSIPYDAYIAGGDASCVELSLATGYSFVVVPDARLPRATAAISEGSSGALASPADPGDSVDALMGLLVPREEGQAEASMPQTMGSRVQAILNPVNPALEYPYEHADAQYPNAQQPGTQQANFLNAPSAAYSDPSGLVSVDGTAGQATAGATAAAAEAGGGAALSLPLLGVGAGRFSAVSQAQVTSATVEQTSTCSLQDLTIAPPGTGFSLHVGSLAASLQTQRPLGGTQAVVSRSIQLADVTLNGKEILPAGQTGITIPATTVTVPQPPLPPGTPAPASIQSVSLTGTSTSSALSASNNEATATLTALTVVITTTAPVPSSIPPAPGGNPISTTPAVYTIRLGSLDSQAYGLPTTASGLGGAPGATGGGLTAAGTPLSSAGMSLGSRGFPGSVSRFPGSRGTRGAGAAEPLAGSALVPGTPAAVRWGVVGLGALLETLLLGGLYLRHRRGRSPQPSPAAPAAFLDLP